MQLGVDLFLAEIIFVFLRCVNVRQEVSARCAKWFDVDERQKFIACNMATNKLFFFCPELDYSECLKSDFRQFRF